MNDQSRRDALRSVFRSVLDDQAEPDSPHVVDDDNLLARWDADLMTADDRRQIIDHLAVCPRCRHELADLVRAGVIAPIDRAGLPLRQRDRRRLISPATWTIAIAASLLVAMGGILWLISVPRRGLVLAQLEDSVRLGRYNDALQEAKALSRKELHPEERRRAQALCEEAGYRAAESALGNSDWGAVERIESLASSLSAGSSRLLNLSLQAQQEIPNASSLAYEGSLLDQGFAPSGRSLRKSLPFEDEATKHLCEQYAQAVQRYPQDMSLRLNLGQLLWELGRTDEAEAQFQAARQLDVQNPNARLGLGLVEYRRHHYQQALEHFEAALREDPRNLAARINAAACLEQLGRPDDAQKEWEHLLQALPDGDRRRRQIELHSPSPR